MRRREQEEKWKRENGRKARREMQKGMIRKRRRKNGKTKTKEMKGKYEESGKGKMGEK